MAKIELRGVDVSYPVFSAGRQESLFSNVLSRASFGIIGRSALASTEVKALRNISFTLRDGDRLGVIGANGSGKTTLLRTIAGINWPQQGLIDIQGKVASLISIGAGLDAERTGFENIDFVCRLFQIPRHRREDIAAEIAEFTQLGEFMNLPIRTYSTGMVVRLTFALATALPGEILVVDEVLGAGDAAFQVRAAERTRARYADTSIFVMATHSPAALVEYCNYCIWLDRGQVIDHGEPAEIWDRYVRQEPRGQQLTSTPRRAPPAKAAAEPEPAPPPATHEASAPAAAQEPRKTKKRRSAAPKAKANPKTRSSSSR